MPLSLSQGLNDDEFWDQFPQGTERALLFAALEAFADRGYDVTTTRDIARLAGLSPAGLYIHYPSKASLLFELSRAGHEAAETILKNALDPERGGSGGRVERIAASIGSFASWHASHRILARVVQLELRSLEDEAYATVAAIRRRTQRMLADEIQAAVDTGEIDIPDVRGVTRALMSLCIDVCRWYKPEGPQHPDGIASLYQELAVRILQPVTQPQALSVP